MDASGAQRKTRATQAKGRPRAFCAVLGLLRAGKMLLLVALTAPGARP